MSNKRKSENIDTTTSAVLVQFSRKDNDNKDNITDACQISLINETSKTPLKSEEVLSLLTDTLRGSMESQIDNQRFSFYVDDKENLTQLTIENSADILTKSCATSSEEALNILYAPMNIQKIKPVTRLATSLPGHKDAILSLSFSPYSSLLATASGDHTVKVWSVHSLWPIATCIGHTDWVFTVKWRPDGDDYFCSGDRHGDTFIWSVDSRHIREKKKNPDKQCKQKTSSQRDMSPIFKLCQTRQKTGNKSITAVDWAPLFHTTMSTANYFSVITCAISGEICIYKILSDKFNIASGLSTIHPSQILSGHSSAVMGLTWTSNKLFTCSRDRNIKVWENLQDETFSHSQDLKGHAHWINSISANCDYLTYTGSFDIYEPMEKSENTMLIDHVKFAQSRYKKIINSGKYILSGSDDNTLCLWVVKSDSIIQLKKKITGHQNIVTCVRWSPDGSMFASCSFDKSVRIWNGSNGDLLKTFRGHISPVYQIAWGADSNLIVSGSKDSTVKAWSVSEGKLKSDLPGHGDDVFAVDWSGCGGFVASGGRDKIVKIWRN